MTLIRAFFDLPWLNSVVARGPKATAVAAVALAFMLVGLAGTIRTGRWTLRLMALVGAAVWPLPDHAFQGPILVSLSYRHGVHLTDLLSVVVAVAAVLPWRGSRPAAPPARLSTVVAKDSHGK